ncbi:MAG: serine protease Do [Thermoleophilaceae bacterium]|nr:serine protease Do [Thermoleophilaceae bacterium]
MQLRINSGPNAGQTVDVTGDEFTIGREEGVNLVLSGDGKVSRRHAALKPLPDGRATLYDLGSSNGTYVNGQRIQSTVLSGNEQVQIGDTLMVPVAPVPSGAAVGGAEGTTTARPIPSAPVAPAAQPAQPAPPTQQQPPAFQPPAAPPVARPSRTQSAIQRVMLQRAVNRATIVGVVAIVLVVVLGVLAALGVFSSGGGGAGEDASAVIPKVAPSTVLVVTNKGGGSGERGTGWVWDASQGLIVTNAHVVAGGQSYSIAQGDKVGISADPSGALTAGQSGRPATLKGGGLCEDIAVLQVKDSSGLVTIPQLPAGQDLKIGERVIAVGYPASATASQNPGFDAVLTGDTGDIAQPHTTFPSIPGGDFTTGPYQDVSQISTVINQGNSGGPLVNFKGQLVGMNTAKNNQNVGQNYAITIQRIRQIVPKLIAGQKVCG